MKWILIITFVLLIIWFIAMWIYCWPNPPTL
jgi:hypothetical protein